MSPATGPCRCNAGFEPLTHFVQAAAGCPRWSCGSRPRGAERPATRRCALASRSCGPVRSLSRTEITRTAGSFGIPPGDRVAAGWPVLFPCRSRGSRGRTRATPATSHSTRRAGCPGDVPFGARPGGRSPHFLESLRLGGSAFGDSSPAWRRLHRGAPRRSPAWLGRRAAVRRRRDAVIPMNEGRGTVAWRPAATRGGDWPPRWSRTRRRAALLGLPGPHRPHLRPWPPVLRSPRWARSTCWPNGPPRTSGPAAPHVPAPGSSRWRGRAPGGRLFAGWPLAWTRPGSPYEDNRIGARARSQPRRSPPAPPGPPPGGGADGEITSYRGISDRPGAEWRAAWPGLLATAALVGTHGSLVYRPQDRLVVSPRRARGRLPGGVRLAWTWPRGPSASLPGRRADRARPAENT